VLVLISTNPILSIGGGDQGVPGEGTARLKPVCQFRVCGESSDNGKWWRPAGRIEGVCTKESMSGVYAGFIGFKSNIGGSTNCRGDGMRVGPAWRKAPRGGA
jgi:hypothetical protein